MAFTTYQKAARVAGSDSFTCRVKGIITKVAVDVKGEAYTTVEQTLPNNDVVNVPSDVSRKRSLLADSILVNPSANVERFAYAIATQPGISAVYAPVITADTWESVEAGVDALSDNDIEFSVSSVWNDLAGVNGWDTVGV